MPFVHVYKLLEGTSFHEKYSNSDIFKTFCKPSEFKTNEFKTFTAMKKIIVMIMYKVHAWNSGWYHGFPWIVLRPAEGSPLKVALILKGPLKIACK